MKRRRSPAPRRPLTVEVLEARERALNSGKWKHEEELRAHYLERLQRVAITPAVIEREYDGVAAIYRECLALAPDHVSNTLVELHHRMVNVIAFHLLREGTVDPDRARVLDTLAAMLRVSGIAPRQGWDTLSDYPPEGGGK